MDLTYKSHTAEREGEKGGEKGGWAAAREGEKEGRGVDWAEQAERRRGRERFHFFLFQTKFPNAFSN